MTIKPSTTEKHIEKDFENVEIKKLILEFYNFMKRIGRSEIYQNNNL